MHVIRSVWGLGLRLWGLWFSVNGILNPVKELTSSVASIMHATAMGEVLVVIPLVPAYHDDHHCYCLCYHISVSILFGHHGASCAPSLTLPTLHLQDLGPKPQTLNPQPQSETLNLKPTVPTVNPKP